MELLVVISIIALLIAILLPALAKVRQRAQSAVCLNNLRSAAQSMLMYTNDHRGWLPGSPSTTGRQLWQISPDGQYISAGYTEDNVPPPAIELFDYIGPLCAITKATLPETPSGIDRLRAYRQLQTFRCPSSDDIIATRASGAMVEDGLILSYCTPTAFMLAAAKVPTTENTTFAGRVTMPTGGSPTDPAHFNFWSSPPNYVPKITMAGPRSRKIFLADSGRRMRHTGSPQFIYDVESDYANTLFSDFGPFYGITRSYDRYAANNGFGEGVIDARVYAYRHGTQRPGQSSGSYEMNVVFFDGHAATLNDIESARPEYWLPTGSIIYRNTKLNATDTVFWNDVWSWYLADTIPAAPYQVP